MFLSILPMRGPQAYNEFIKGLYESDQKYIAEELQAFQSKKMGSKMNRSKRDVIKLFGT